MTMTEDTLRADCLTVRDGRYAVAVHLPWYRSLPLSCLEAVDVVLDGAPVNVTRVHLPGFDGSLDQAATSETDWDLRDPLVVATDRTSRPSRVEVTLALRIPYLQQAPGVPLVQRVTVGRACDPAASPPPTQFEETAR